MTLLTLLNTPTLATYTAAGFWGNETIYHLAARRACVTPGAFAVTDRHRRLTYAALVAGADRLAGHLAGNGLHAGDRVAVWLPSRVETAIALLACSRNAYVCCPSLHRDHRVGEVAALIALPGYGADGDRYDVFTEVAGRDFLRFYWPVGAPDKAPFPSLAGPAIDRPVSSDANQIMYL